ncbi:MAG: ATP-dependent 6-phosphofructokinase [Proteobacteria bacterium]|nr:ATP-dependent 6-phosphofructokinase [Pseudomonadota bacterium]
MRVGVLTGGGDCAGLNSAIKWVTKTALDPFLDVRRQTRMEVVGIRDGWRGLVEVEPDDPESVARWTLPLNELLVRTWDRYGGTNLGTSRVNPFSAKEDRSRQVLEHIGALGLDVLVAIGGEDTLSVAHRLDRLGVRVVGIPKTIDRDLSATDYTLGYDTALNVIAEEVDRLRTTAGSHSRTFVVETMGRHAGWLALEGGEAAGAYIILIPEWDFEIDRVVELLDRRRSAGVRYEIVVVSEGAKVRGGAEVYLSDKSDEFGHKVLGGIAQTLSREIEKRGGWETRYVVLSHLQRGGQPSAHDRLMGRRFGIAAVDLILKGAFGRMTALVRGEIDSVPLEAALERLYTVDVDRYYDTDRYNGRRCAILQ